MANAADGNQFPQGDRRLRQLPPQGQGSRPRSLPSGKIQYPSRHQVQVQTTLMPRPAHTSFGLQIFAPLPYQVYGHGQVPYNICISYPPIFVLPPPHAAPVYGHGLYNSISSPPVPVTVPIGTPIRESGSEGFPGPRFPPPPPHHDHQEEGLTRPQHCQSETRPSKGVALTPELTGLSLEKMIQFPVHYWFSPENLREDKFLKQNMDAEGWVPISHIITFPGLANIEHINCSLVAESLRDSPNVEVRMEDLMIRKRDDWFNYLPQRP